MPLVLHRSRHPPTDPKLAQRFESHLSSLSLSQLDYKRNEKEKMRRLGEIANPITDFQIQELTGVVAESERGFMMMVDILEQRSFQASWVCVWRLGG